MKLPQPLLSFAAKLALQTPFVHKASFRAGLGLIGRPKTGRFLSYTVDFERAYTSDRWDAIEPYFAPDAVYEVRNAPFACRLEGAPQIIQGFRRCLDTFDRQLERNLWVFDGPHETGDRVTFRWKGLYNRPGEPPLRLEARQTAIYRDDLIVDLSDEYAPGVDAAIEKWLDEHGRGLVPTYV